MSNAEMTPPARAGESLSRFSEMHDGRRGFVIHSFDFRNFIPFLKSGRSYGGMSIQHTSKVDGTDV